MLDVFNNIYAKIAIPSNYLPRQYSTMGGGWTVDTWKYKDIAVAQLMDEGYTQRILADGLDVSRDFNNNLTFHKGTKQDLQIVGLSVI